MFGIGVWEIVVILLVALLVLGPDKLPQVARQVGKGLQELRKASGDLQASFQEAINASDEERRQASSPPRVTPATGAEPRPESDAARAAGALPGTSADGTAPPATAPTAAAAPSATSSSAASTTPSTAPVQPSPAPLQGENGGNDPHTLAG